MEAENVTNKTFYCETQLKYFYKLFVNYKISSVMNMFPFAHYEAKEGLQTHFLNTFLNLFETITKKNQGCMKWDGTEGL